MQAAGGGTWCRSREVAAHGSQPLLEREDRDTDILDPVACPETKHHGSHLRGPGFHAHQVVELSGMTRSGRAHSLA